MIVGLLLVLFIGYLFAMALHFFVSDKPRCWCAWCRAFGLIKKDDSHVD